MTTKTFAEELELRVRLDVAQQAVIDELNRYILVMGKQHHTTEDAATIITHPIRLAELENKLTTLKAEWYDKETNDSN